MLHIGVTFSLKNDKNHLDRLIKFLERNNNFTNKIEVIKAEIHFDQTAPHMHIHLSNLYEKTLKTHKEPIVKNNENITDWIRINLTKQNELIKLNSEEFTNYLNPNLFHFMNVFLNKNFKHEDNYNQTNNIDLKWMFPLTYHPKVFKKYNLGFEAKFEFWREDKENFILNAETILAKLNLKNELLSNNDIETLKTINNIAEYCLYQTLALNVLAKETKILSSNELKNKIEIAYKQQSSINFWQINKKIVEPQNIKKNFPKIELAKMYPHLAKIEKKLDLKLLNHNLLIDRNLRASKINKLKNQLTFRDFHKMKIINTVVNNQKISNTILIDKNDLEQKFILQRNEENEIINIQSLNSFLQENNLNNDLNLKILDNVEQKINEYLENKKDHTLDLTLDFEEEKNQN